MIGTVVGVAAAGAAVGVAAERMIFRRTRMSQTELMTEPFGKLPFDEAVTVPTLHGIDLYVELVEPLGSGVDDPTLLFVHGFCLDMGTFHFQRRQLSSDGGYRMVFYDQPGHGRSTRLTEGEYTLEQLAQGLKDVLDSVVPNRPVVLVGHSMGGMTIMRLASAYPEIFGTHVTGVVLISTSAGNLGDGALGLPDVLGRLSRQLLPLVSRTGGRTGSVIDAARRAGTDLAWLLTRRYGFGARKPDPVLVSYVERMNERTSTEVVARYLRAIFAHAAYPALEHLARVPVLVICGDADALTPLAHTEEICRALPKAELVIVPEAGHVALLERPDAVNDAIIDFLDRLRRRQLSPESA